MAMTSSQPYIVRAIYQWIVDNDCTPYLLVNACEPGVEVPQEYVKDGEIILNISPLAVRSINLADEGIDFEGRFGGIPRRILVPMSAIMGIYTKEHGKGMMFERQEKPPEPLDSGDGSSRSGADASLAGRSGRGRKNPLRLVK